mmetsp:Transcript_27298/g.44456  ORF Transcript_27298/g.44456 Transcript_27298/m.44456 type:complete len:220 (+) Transcript_27298:246-905(+)
MFGRTGMDEEGVLVAGVEALMREECLARGVRMGEGGFPNRARTVASREERWRFSEEGVVVEINGEEEEEEARSSMDARVRFARAASSMEEAERSSMVVTCTTAVVNSTALASWWGESSNSNRCQPGMRLSKAAITVLGPAIAISSPSSVARAHGQYHRCSRMGWRAPACPCPCPRLLVPLSNMGTHSTKGGGRSSSIAVGCESSSSLSMCISEEGGREC